MNGITVETTRCSGADCVEVVDIGSDWFRVRSTTNRNINVAVTGHELRAFLRQVRAGQFDAIAGLEPDTTVGELLDENAELRGRLQELEQFADAVDCAMENAA